MEGYCRMITHKIFQAFLNCHTKAFLRSSGADGDQGDFVNWQRKSSEAYKLKCSVDLAQHLKEDECLSDASFSDARKNANCRLVMNCFVEGRELRSTLDALECGTAPMKGEEIDYIPIRFVPAEKITIQDKLLLAFDALAIYSACSKMPPFGKITYGSKQVTIEVQLDALIETTRALVERIASQQVSSTPPPLALNKHCVECEFRAGCYQIAVQRDDLTLLAGMNENDRRRLHDKGIFTVTQLSYTYRARRNQKRFASRPDKYNHALKALAIREHKIYISGRSDLKIHGNPVYFDVEGIPDRASYYLIGLRVRVGNSIIQHSFWANERSEEKDIWVSLLQRLAKIENPQLIHYGRYETQFLKRMRERYPKATENRVLVDRLITDAVNILSYIYGLVYFPTYTNGLKEVAQFLGFRWSDIDASGLNSLVWRLEWESSQVADLKHHLVTYNAEDCEALERVTTFIAQICDRASCENAVADNKIVLSDSVRQDYPYRFGKRHFSLHELEYLNQAAYWNPQHDKIRIRSSEKLEEIPRRNCKRSTGNLPIDMVFELPAPICCTNCKSTNIREHDTRSKIVRDLKLEPYCIKRWIVKYVFKRYFCRQCQLVFAPPEKPWTRNKYGRELIAYSVYQIIELQIPQSTVVRSLNQSFRLNIKPSTLNSLKAYAADQYGDTYSFLLDKIVHGNLILADETKVEIQGKIGFVWVVRNLGAVVYFFTESREGDRIQTLLTDFQGVLVSDFYGAYDQIKCYHQRCLIHLIRDLNEDIQKEPFNEELKSLAQEFGILLKAIVETIDRLGSKADHLRTHKIPVDQFYLKVYERGDKSELAIKYKRRFLKYRDQLFTFLDYDDIPWNNNYAEHAVKTFARLRRVIGGASSDKGIRDYLTLLSISETCKYRGVNFLDFLRSGEVDIDRFAESVPDPSQSNEH